MSRWWYILFLFALGFLSCRSGGEVEEITSNTVEIEIRKIDSSGITISSKTISDKKEIKDILKIVSNAEAPTYKCGHDYEIHCKSSNNNFIVIELNSADICAVASFIYQDELIFRYLNKEKIIQLENQLNNNEL